MNNEITQVLKQAAGADVDSKAARKNALELAALLGSKVVPNDKIVVNEGYWPFKIPVHTKEFYCFLFVSDVFYHFTANRRPKTPDIGDFFVSLKTPCQHMLADELVPKVAKQLGVPVFRQRFLKNKVIEQAFSSKRMRDTLRQVSFNRIQQFNLSPIQLDVVASVRPIEACVRDVSVFQTLMTVAIEEACEKYKDLLD